MVLGGSSSGFYYWFQHPVSQPEQIKEVVYQKNKCRYGSPRIAVELQPQGIKVSRPRVAHLMQKHRIQSIVRKNYLVQTTDSCHGNKVAKNYLGWVFQAARPVEQWVSDLTYIGTGKAVFI